METMYDSTNVAAIPPGATLILVYIDGKYQTATAARARFPNARLVPTTTTVAGNLAAQIYDCERGDGNAIQACTWARQKIAIKQRPTIYCSRIGSPGYGWPDVLAAMPRFGLTNANVDFGIADYTYTPHLVPGSAFTQYTNPPKSGGEYDISITNGIWPNPPSPPSPLPTGEPDMLMALTSTGKGYWLCAPNGAVYAFGDAQYLGGLNTSLVNGEWTGPPALLPGQTVTSIVSTPTIYQGYWLTTNTGLVYTYGDAVYHGGIGSPSV